MFMREVCPFWILNALLADLVLHTPLNVSIIWQTQKNTFTWHLFSIVLRRRKLQRPIHTQTIVVLTTNTRRNLFKIEDDKQKICHSPFQNVFRYDSKRFTRSSCLFGVLISQGNWNTHTHKHLADLFYSVLICMKIIFHCLEIDCILVIRPIRSGWLWQLWRVPAHEKQQRQCVRLHEQQFWWFDRCDEPRRQLGVQMAAHK